MPHRRTILVSTAASLLAAAGWPARPAHAQSALQHATSFIKDVGDQLVAVVNSSQPDAQKRNQLTQIIDGAVDVDAVAKFCLGRFWRSASSQQQQNYTTLFHQVLVNNITSKLGEYRGVSFVMGKAQMRDEDAVVSTVVNRPNNPPTNVDWIVTHPVSTPKIIDVVAEGTSLRLTQRQDYASYLSHNNDSIDALINAMRQQVAQAG
ncbi:MAG TPA: ABC transporter substrate-binding protein [Acetobacteraceae bacterium]|nr:ABC transporter substrate-binding protein [Acetobacteraceae bacterium]